MELPWNYLDLSWNSMELPWNCHGTTLTSPGTPLQFQIQETMVKQKGENARESRKSKENHENARKCMTMHENVRKCTNMHENARHRNVFRKTRAGFGITSSWRRIVEIEKVTQTESEVTICGRRCSSVSASMWTVPCLTFESVQATIPVETEVFGEVASGTNINFHSYCSPRPRQCSAPMQ